MAILKFAVLAFTAFLSAVGIFIGLVIALASLKSGAIEISYPMDGKVITETITQAGDSARYWRLVLAVCGLPVVIGSAALWYSVKKLRGN